jgi:hypothetical protein
MGLFKKKAPADAAEVGSADIAAADAPATARMSSTGGGSSDKNPFVDSGKLAGLPYIVSATPSPLPARHPARLVFVTSLWLGCDCGCDCD